MNADGQERALVRPRPPGTARFEHGRKAFLAFAAIAVPLLALLGPLVCSDRLPAMRDAGHYYYPLFKWCADEWGAGRPPLWSPRENGGTAVHADPTASIWYPGKLLFALPLGFAARYKLYIALHAVLCAAGAWRLARRFEASQGGAAIAAMSYACGGSVIFQHCNIVYLVGAAWLPFALESIDELLRTRRWQAAAGLGATLALMVLGGDPQMAYHVLLAGGLYALVQARGTHQPAGDAAIGSKLKSFAGSLALLVAAGLIAALLAAVQILPSAEATAHSTRARFERPRSLEESLASGDFTLHGMLGKPVPGTHHATAYDFSVGPWRLAELVWPNCAGRMFPTHRRWMSLWPAEGRIWTPSLYLGLVPLVLALSSFSLRSDNARIRWLSWLVLLFTLGSFGAFGLGWLARQIYLLLGNDSADFRLGDGVGGVYWLLVVLLPKYVLFRYPAKLLVVAALAIGQLAALGWDRALLDPTRVRAFLNWLGVGSALAAVTAAIAAQYVVLGEAAADPAFGPFDDRGAWTDIISSLVQTALVGLAAAWLLGRRKSAMLLLLCAVELAVANSWLVPLAPAKLWRAPVAIAAAIGDRASPPSIYRAPRWWPSDFAQGSSDQRLAEMVAWERQTLAGRYALLEGVSPVNSQTGLQPADRKAQLVQAEYLILPAGRQLESAERVSIDGLPAGAALWRARDRPGADHERQRPFEPQPFYRGAALSTISWVLLCVVAGWACFGHHRRRVGLALP